jgi:hypothetical protein
MPGKTLILAFECGQLGLTLFSVFILVPLNKIVATTVFLLLVSACGQKSSDTRTHLESTKLAQLRAMSNSQLQSYIETNGYPDLSPQDIDQVTDADLSRIAVTRQEFEFAMENRIALASPAKGANAGDDSNSNTSGQPSTAECELPLVAPRTQRCGNKKISEEVICDNGRPDYRHISEYRAVNRSEKTTEDPDLMDLSRKLVGYIYSDSWLDKAGVQQDPPTYMPGKIGQNVAGDDMSLAIQNIKAKVESAGLVVEDVHPNWAISQGKFYWRGMCMGGFVFVFSKSKVPGSEDFNTDDIKIVNLREQHRSQTTFSVQAFDSTCVTI